MNSINLIKIKTVHNIMLYHSQKIKRLTIIRIFKTYLYHLSLIIKKWKNT